MPVPSSVLHLLILMGLAACDPEAQSQPGLREEPERLTLSPQVTAGPVEPRQVRALCAQASLALLRGEYARSRDLYRSALEIDAGNPGAYYNLGLSLIKLTAYTEAVDALSSAVQVDSSYALAWYTLGQVYVDRLGKYNLAVMSMRRVVELRPGEALGHVGLGQAYLGARDFAAAASAYHRAIALDTLDAEAYFGLGLTRETQGEAEAAEDLYLRAVQLDPVHAKAYFRLGGLHRQRGDVAEARRFLKLFERMRPRAARISRLKTQLLSEPDNAWLHHQLGTLYAKFDMPLHAIRSLQSGLELHSDFAPGYNNLGNVYFRHGRVEEALAMYQAAVHRDSSYALAHSNLGSVWLVNERLDAAQKAFERALQLQPDFADAQYGLALVYRRRGDHVKERRALERYEQMRGK